MSMNRTYVLYILFPLLFLSCNRGSIPITYHVNHIKDIECPTIPYSVTQIQHFVDTGKFESIFCYLNPSNTTIGICLDMKYDINIKLTPINYIAYTPTASDFFIHSFDSIFYFNRSLMTVTLLDTSEQIINKFPMISEYPPNPISSNFFIFSEYLYYSCVPEDISTRLKRKHSFTKTSPICKVSYDRIKMAYKYTRFGIFPDAYQTGNNYYNFGPDIFMGLDGQIVISYEADHHVYAYRNLKMIRKKLCKSNHIDDFIDISDDDLSNPAYCQYYLGQEPRYKSIITDPYYRRYYRITKHRLNLKRADIKEAKWSIIILNEKFDIIGEVDFSYADYMPDIVIPSKYGLYLKKTAKSKQDIDRGLKLSLVSFDPY